MSGAARPLASARGAHAVLAACAPRVPPMRRAAVGLAWALAWTLAWGGAILGFAHRVHAEPQAAAAPAHAAFRAR